MTFVLYRGCLRRNRASVALSGCSTKHDNSEIMDDLSVSRPDAKESVFAPEASILPESSAALYTFTASLLVLKYSQDDLHRILKAVLEA